jgi:hypothetical protein
VKPRAQIILAVAVVLGVAAWSSMRRGARSNADGRNSGACCPLLAALDSNLFAVRTNQIATNAAAQQVVAYYFHGTVRCETCLQIEAQARAVIERQFSVELAVNRLVFLPVNYEQPENAHFLTDYQLPCPSLVLARQKAGKDEKWKLLGEVWQLVQDPEKLNHYVETEVKTFLGGLEQQTSTHQVELLLAPDHP